MTKDRIRFIRIKEKCYNKVVSFELCDSSSDEYGMSTKDITKNNL